MQVVWVMEVQSPSNKSTSGCHYSLLETRHSPWTYSPPDDLPFCYANFVELWDHLVVLTCITRFSVLVWLVSGLCIEYKMSVV